MVFAEPDSPVYLLPAFDIVAVMLENQPLVEPAFRTGKGVGWGNQSQCLFCTTGQFFRPGYQNNLVSSWLPALDGVTAKLESGATVADVGCGHGFSTIIMAKAYPKSTFIGYDFHPSSAKLSSAITQGVSVPCARRRRRPSTWCSRRGPDSSLRLNFRFGVETCDRRVHREFPLRVDLMRSPSPRRMAAICAKGTAGIDAERTLRIALVNVAIGLTALLQGPSWKRPDYAPEPSSPIGAKKFSFPRDRLTTSQGTT
jgi:hypothetical protein